MGRWWRRSRKAVRDAAEELTRAEVLVECHDETVSASEALTGAGFDRPDEVLLRHLLFVDADRREPVLARCGMDGYVEAPALPSDPSAPAGRIAVAVARLQRVDARTLSQERAIIGSMTARLGGESGGWAVLAAPDSGSA